MGTTSVAEDRRSGPPPPVHCHDGGCDHDHDHDDDASLASSGASLSATTTTGTKTVVDHRGAEADEIERLIYKETRRVQLSRSFFLLMLLAATTVIVTVAYAVFNNKDRDELQISFNASAETIQWTALSQLEDLYRAGHEVGESLSRSAAASNSSWPFVTSRNFELYARPWRESAQAAFISFLPVVSNNNLTKWESYSVANQDWMERSFAIDGTVRPNNASISATVYEFDNASGTLVPVPATTAGSFPLTPLWEVSPPPLDPAPINFDALSQPWFQSAFSSQLPALGDGTPAPSLLNLTLAGPQSISHNNASQATTATASAGDDEPMCLSLSPIYERPHDNASDIVGVVWTLIPWAQFLTSALPVDHTGVLAILNNTCTRTVYSFGFEENQAIFLGTTDQHSREFDFFAYSFSLNPLAEPLKNNDTVKSGPPSCVYQVYLFPTHEYEDAFVTATPLVAALWMAFVMACLILTFFIYELYIQRKNRRLIGIATRSNRLIGTLFPANVRERLFAEDPGDLKKLGTTDQLRNLLSRDDPAALATKEGDDEDESLSVDLASKPIADLFPETTIMFADIAGFTSWSSIREPAQVFTLLETLYGAFDKIAERRGIFKVETVGDCYVAVTGLPEPRNDHAVAMAKFANEALLKMQVLTKKLEVELGPDTSELSMRCGLHSGPVTAGVLRGKRSRFQLFGDTMNTASRMESTSRHGCIQVSQETADLLLAAGKTHWLVKRDDVIYAKGKGKMQTFWLEMRKRSSAGSRSDSKPSMDTSDHSLSNSSVTVSDMGDSQTLELINDRTTRLVNWTVEVLRKLLRQVVARREAQGSATVGPDQLKYKRQSGHTVLDEVAEVIIIPGFDAKVAKRQKESSLVYLGEDVEMQLHAYVTNIAYMYRDNPFHNFEHVAHVIMSVSKLLSRIVAPSPTSFPQKRTAPSKSSAKSRKEKDIEDFMSTIAHDAVGQFIVDHSTQQNRKQSQATKMMLHDHTYGITSDPLTQFACVFSALIHDVDHTGVPNTQLAVEQPAVASAYKGKSLAEQVSVDLAWNLLQDDCYSALRNAIYASEAEMKRFRQLVVNSVMATDIMDKDLKELRNARWDKAFSESADAARLSSCDNTNRKATIVIEHIIQASDVAHTMQHWHVYRQWNERLFRELKQAFAQGRSDKDPAEFWYQGEIGFFDFYVIPLAKKLKECGVFGVSSAECLNYALLNRQEWVDRGKEIVAEYMQNFASQSREKTKNEEQDMVLTECPDEAVKR